MDTTAVSFKRVINATVHADNSGDTGRTTDISADVNIANGHVDSFFNGRCEKPASDDTPAASASFARQADDNLQPRGKRGHHGGHAACCRRVHCRGLGRADVNRGRNSLIKKYMPGVR